jgi:mannitol operon repressor
MNSVAIFRRMVRARDPIITQFHGNRVNRRTQMPVEPKWSLKEFTHEHLREAAMFLAELSRESDRGKVLIATGFMEQQLRNVLAAFMLEGVDATSLLDGGSAPLSTFSARTAACHALGLITDDENHDLGLIRKIRNEFAHKTEVSFMIPSIRDRCAILRMRAPDYEDEKRGKVVMTPSEQFQTSAVAIIMNLVNRPHYVGQQRRIQQKWPY